MKATICLSTGLAIIVLSTIGWLDYGVSMFASGVWLTCTMSFIAELILRNRAIAKSTEPETAPENPTYKTYLEIIRDADAVRAAATARGERAFILWVLIATTAILGLGFAFAT